MIRVEFDPTNYNQLFSVILDSVEYLFHLSWNNALSKRGFRESGWELTIYDPALFDINDFLDSGEAQYEALIQGATKLMPNTQILNNAYFTELPTGVLFCGDRSSEQGLSDEEYYIGLDNFGVGKRFDLYYTTEEEALSL
ncbi:hypothetical protein NVP1187O_184 [Vibrio phage 1.187.O._10N.286.49.F1]|nr:hypothetical protein NVP1187O_184 [Vibrio phage 1.187.O._10N.286.49.F1]